MTESILVAYDDTYGKDKAVLCVGKKRPNDSVEIINAFQGDEATELWNKLVVKEKR
jgi:hypothetical protein